MLFGLGHIFTKTVGSWDFAPDPTGCPLHSTGPFSQFESFGCYSHKVMNPESMGATWPVFGNVKHHLLTAVLNSVSIACLLEKSGNFMCSGK